MEIHGLAITHPAITVSQSLIVLVQVLFVLLVLRWGWVTSYSDHAFAVLMLSVVVLFGFYKTLN